MQMRFSTESYQAEIEMRILHTSDWHLGRQFYGQSLLADQQLVLDQIVAVVREREVDVVVIAGDIYDRSVPPSAAIDVLDHTLTSLCRDLGVPVVVISGNHDGGDRLNFGARQMAASGLHVVGKLWDQPEEIIVCGRDGDQLAFYPIPYTDPAAVRYQHAVDVTTHQQAMEHLVAMIASARHGDLPAIAVAHCFLAGAESSESERPLSLGGLEYVDPQIFSPFAYTALGHLHGPQARFDNKVVYSGSPLKYSFSEEHQHKSVSVIDIVYGAIQNFERVPLKSVKNMRTIEGSLEQLVSAGKSDPACEDYLQIRLTDTHAILDVMNKLRDVYPNVLHLERPGLMRQEQVSCQRDLLARGELAMFADFFQQTTGDVLTAEQQNIIRDELEQLHREDV